MKIVSLQIEAFKRLRAVSIHPNGSLVQITGKNGQGKTSILDALWVALAGAGVSPKDPIRHGADKAMVRVDCGELTITRTFKRAGEDSYTTSIVVEAAGGAPVKSPQKVLDDLVGSLSFDPFAFTRLKPLEQFAELARFVPGVDFEKIQQEHDADFSRRTDINRRAKEEAAAANAMIVQAEASDEPVNVKELVDELAEVSTTNAAIQERQQKRAAARQQVADMAAKIATLKDAAVALRAQAQAKDDEAAAIEKERAELAARLERAPALPDPVDVEDLRRRINEAEQQNRVGEQLRLNSQRRKDHLERAAALEMESDQLTERMTARQAAKNKAIAEAKIPVQGLGFGEGFVTLNGVPFEQASDAEKLRASVAIAMAANPKLRVLRIRDGSLLDEDSINLLRGMLEESDFQCWIEQVDSSGKVGFVIEDGAVKGAETIEAPPPAAKPAPVKRQRPVLPPEGESEL